MNSTRCIVVFASITFLLSSCANAPSEGAAYSSGNGPAADAPGSAYAADSSAAAVSLTDPARKILRTADLRCRVPDAYAAAAALEAVVRATGGAITESRLEASETSTTEVALGDDSLKQIRTFATTAHLTLRVPVARLDSIVRLVPQGALFLHHRTLAQEDATLRYLSAELKNNADRPAGDAAAKARRTADVIAASEYEDQRTGRRIDRRIGNLDILDRAAFATLTVAYYEPQRVDVQVIVNPVAAARTPLGVRMAVALRSGWRGMEGLLVALIALWPLWLAGTGGWMLYRAMRRGMFTRFLASKP